MRQYEHLRDVLAAELDVEPGPEAQRLYEEVRARQTSEPELSAELWERVGELRMVAGDTPGAVKAFSLALDFEPEGDAVERLHRQAASALLMRFDAEGAEPHLEAAEALGMTARQRLLLVRLPLAAPVIMAGVRTAAVITVGAATLAAFR